MVKNISKIKDNGLTSVIVSAIKAQEAQGYSMLPYRSIGGNSGVYRVCFNYFRHRDMSLDKDTQFDLAKKIIKTLIEDKRVYHTFRGKLAGLALLPNKDVKPASKSVNAVDSIDITTLL